MSGGGEHLKDEVLFDTRRYSCMQLTDLCVQGSRQQVVIAGAIAGLVSRLRRIPWNRGSRTDRPEGSV